MRRLLLHLGIFAKTSFLTKLFAYSFVLKGFALIRPTLNMCKKYCANI